MADGAALKPSEKFFCGGVQWEKKPEYIPAQQQDQPGKKFDMGKLRMDLIPIGVLKGLARALTYGADKYGDRNWEDGFSWSRAYGALLRHLTAWWDGEEMDHESRLHHLDLALAEMAFLHTFLNEHYDGFDDRPHKRDARH